MVLSIQLPSQNNNLTQSEIISKLIELSPRFEIYIVSFFVVGIFWIAYHFVLIALLHDYFKSFFINVLASYS